MNESQQGDCDPWVQEHNEVSEGWSGPDLGNFEQITIRADQPQMWGTRENSENEVIFSFNSLHALNL
jgi:hypothetical protein